MRELIEKVASLAREHGLGFLLIGGNALAFYGYPRNTLDVDFLIRDDELEKWEQILGAMGYRKFHATSAFAQFEKGEGLPADLMVVSDSTWEKLNESARLFSMGSEEFALPSPEHIVALKLHAATSQFRSKPGKIFASWSGFIN